MPCEMWECENANMKHEADDWASHVLQWAAFQITAMMHWFCDAGIREPNKNYKQITEWNAWLIETVGECIESN